MNVGELNEKIAVLALEYIDGTYAWQEKARVWAKVEQLKEKNILSSVGMSAKSIKFTIRKGNLTLHNALRWGQKHCFLTDIAELNRMYYEITAALVEPMVCTVERSGEPALNELNRPVYPDPVTLTFPGCLIEKYLGHNQGEPMATVEIRYVLVIPKAIELEVGELVSICGLDYKVELVHSLDEFKNEYEISSRRDA